MRIDRLSSSLNNPKNPHQKPQAPNAPTNPSHPQSAPEEAPVKRWEAEPHKSTGQLFSRQAASNFVAFADLKDLKLSLE